MDYRTYVTTSIPYVNGRPHVGFALELVQADVIARYHRLLGRKTRLQTGTDENAFKNVLCAGQQGLATAELVRRNAQLFRRLADVLHVGADDFVRTTEARHCRAVQHLWSQVRDGDLYQESYRGLYCTGCEDFYLERDLVQGRCPDHGLRPIEVEESNYFFRLSAYQEKIAQWIHSEKVRIEPPERRREILRFVQDGLRDISISRSADRVHGWGIPVPGDASQIVYVWIDALINYISGPGFGSGQDWCRIWNQEVKKIHVIGKNVWKFHAVYWPALLLSAGLPLPDEILVHGFLTENGRKISKSVGNGIDPFAAVENYGADAVRYYLLRGFSTFADGDFSDEQLGQIYHADLANGLGNLVSRLTALGERGAQERCSFLKLPPPPKGYADAVADYAFGRALESLWATVGRLNRDIDAHRPWDWLKQGKKDKLNAHLNLWLQDLYGVGYWLEPFLPVTSRRILDLLIREEISAFNSLFPRKS